MARRGTRGGRNKVKTVDLAAGPVMLGMNGFDGASRSPRRGTIYWPTLDTRKELTPYSRRELMKKARWGDANVGLVRRCFGGLTMLIGHLTPQAATADPEWNKAAEAAFMRRAKQPLAFDRCGKMDFFEWQKMITRSRLRDGDCLTVLTETQGGGAAQVMLYEAHQVDDGEGEKVDSVVDGVRIDSLGKPLGYRLIDAATRKFMSEIPAESVVFHADIERAGRTRGVTSAAHAISNVIDIIEILADTKHAIKIAAQWGVLLENSGSNNTPQVAAELAAFLGGGTPGEVSENAELLVETIMQGGRMQSTPAGSKVTTLQDTRPHPNQITLLQWLVRDIAWGCGVAPEILWEVSGLNGTGTRYVMAETRRWVEDQHRILERACQRLWTYFIAKEISNGNLPAPQDERWWQARWIPQSDMTIDEGRVGKLELEQLAAGAITYAEVFARRGQDWEDQFAQMAREREMRKMLGLEAKPVVEEPDEEEEEE